ncbi:MAG: hypothetical protein HY525_03995 [Betaproteobacteria bacterium]|nr:hypothetical protein [Betaproteobacteria bacterium]
MSNQVRDREQYKQLFSSARGDASLLSDTLHVALDIRKFEIDLYWKRAGYFWTLIGAAFAGYFLLNKADSPFPDSIFVVSCVGFLVSFAWYLVNRGSKYWQTNWERHVDLLEDEVVGPLYKTTLAKEEFRLVRLHDGYPFSVSKINQLVSLYVALVWLGLLIKSAPIVAPCFIEPSLEYWYLGGLTVVFAVLLIWMTASAVDPRVRNVNFRTSALAPTKEDNGDA